MECLVDPAIFLDAVVVFWPGIFPAGFELLKRKFVRDVAINLVGAKKDEDRFGAMKARGFQKIDRAERVYFKVKNRDIARFVVRGLCGTVNDQIEPLRTEESFEPVAVADIQIVISEVLR